MRTQARTQAGGGMDLVERGAGSSRRSRNCVWDILYERRIYLFIQLKKKIKKKIIDKSQAPLLI